MSFEVARIRYPAGKISLGVDGFVPHSVAQRNDGCCPDPLCVPFCSTACAFVDLLPTGPMWDGQKMDAVRHISECGSEETQSCPTMASYAVYAARVLHDLIDTAIWPAVRESSPQTAVTTIGDWLERFGWQDCFRSSCRSQYMAIFSPYERIGDCGSYYCPTNFDEDFECALQHAILMSLVRMQRGVIKNLDGINWVIAPLGAVVSPVRPWPETVQNVLNGACDPDEIDTCFCDVANLQCCNTGNELPGCPSLICGGSSPPVAAAQPYACGDEDPVILYPGVIAAECIVRALLTRKCPNILFQCQET
jgi:hypothetical protein